MRIDHYDFGTITIDGIQYTSDLKIVRSKVVPNWWRREGHVLNKCDIEDILKVKPEVLIVGTGYSGLMRIADDLKNELDQMRIKLLAYPTPRACKEFNKAATKDVAFAAHLTC